jgi:hypothetical protein
MIWNRVKKHMQSHDAGPRCNVTGVEAEVKKDGEEVTPKKDGEEVTPKKDGEEVTPKKDGEEVTPSALFGCGQCSKVFLTQAFLNQHIERMHANK